MLSGVGIGQEIERKKDAYQNNPQALQQRYQQSQELVDLLALQQLKSEKEAAARNMQMQMQQNPATIAQQREQEVLGMIKQEQGRKLGDVAQRTAGTLGQINKKAQQNVQRTAKQGLPAMGGPRKPAMMAGGGIVGYQGGGGVTDEEIDEYLKNNPLEEYLPRRVIASKIRGQKRQKLSLSERAEEAAKRRTTPASKPTKPTVKPPATSGGVATLPFAGVNLPNIQQQEIERQDREREAAQKAIADRRAVEEAQKPYGTALAQTLMKGPTDRQIDFSDSQFQVTEDTTAKDNLMGMFGKLDKTPEQTQAQETALLQQYDDLMGGAAGLRTLEQQERDLANFDERYSDPKKLQAQARMAGLLSAGAGPLARFGAGMFNAERAQEQQLRKKFLGRQELGRKKIDFKRLTGAEKVKALQQTRSDAAADRRTAMTAYASLASDERTRVEQETNRRVNIALGNQTANNAAESRYVNMLASLAKSEQASFDALQARILDGQLGVEASLTAIAEARATLAESKSKAVAELKENDPRFENVQQALLEAEEGSEEYKAAMAVLNELTAQAESDAARIGQTASIESALDQLEDMVNNRASGLGAMQQTPTISASDIRSAAPSS
jgi:hypothetical protein|tara:strand:- start:6226 stop:8064 length:1839 start_codon:yes stop_codon:yes gene_type:complete